MEANADQALIRRLADGRFHSGAELGEALGISRAAIWKRIRRLEQLGLAVESVRGKGYRLSSPLDLLDPEVLEAAFRGHAALRFLPVTESTNGDALALAGEGVSSPVVITTEFQSAGRGRRGRAWQSPFGANLYLSVLYELAGGYSALGGLSLAAGVAVARALEREAPGLNAGLKWPNDLLVDGAKLGGVLIELAGEMDGRVQVVVGVGLNVAMSDRQADAIDQNWIDLRQACPAPPARTALAGAVGRELLAMLDHFAVDGFAPFMAEFQTLDLCLDRPVTVHGPDGARDGVARGVAEDGALCVDIDDERRLVHGGEVSLRLR
ncbi:MAG TPA: biotin--[acetyl-CoA-carboxylase] ligase [Alcanivorax sp.]|nr:biotin--[acetyl-CoA-carboxylase] ligase [Alcanivorax sp.]MBM1145985.1 biotin--[acetyl-CoA-carboxylase] ligase [Alcanivorax sp. ZXX171]HCE39263.1 biotin--[acetyl-CoA-carboxylase] ligase [Alcanivorax sp.]|tara:strand:+ start:2491 stop:3459 length:969 start_codon:yes stop_codon:yes gene_type:complete